MFSFFFIGTVRAGHLKRRLGVDITNIIQHIQQHNEFMHLSMLSPRVGRGGGRGRADPEEFDIFMEARLLLNVKSPPLA